MAVIRYRFSDGHTEEIEVSDEFAVEYFEMEHKDKLIERKETRRHQSLDKSLEHGWDIADRQADTELQAERNEDKVRVHNALKKLTDKQRAVLISYVLEDKSFREIGEEMGLGTYTVRDYYYNAVKKLKKLLS